MKHRLLIGLAATAFLFLAMAGSALADRVPFSDVRRSDEELTLAMKVLTDFHIVQGYPDNTFRPNQPLTWGQAIAMLSRSPFPSCVEDVTPWEGHPYLCTRGMVRALFPGLLWYEERWQEPITRGQAARLIYRYIILNEV